MKWRLVSFSVVLFMFTANAAFGGPQTYSIVTDGETIYFDLNLKKIAVGFDPFISSAERRQLLSSLPFTANGEIEREAPALGMTLVSMHDDASEDQVTATVEALEKTPAVRWAAPVLMYDGQEHVAGPRLYIQFEESLNNFSRLALQDKYHLSDVKDCDDWSSDMIWAVRPSGSGMVVLDLCRELMSEPGIVWACPDFNRTVAAHTNDTFYNSQWFLNQASDADIDAPEAWSYTTGQSTIDVSICDVGVQITHPDINDKINPGYDAVESDNNPNPETGDDGHGTCCAGLACAETNNSVGVAGAGYNCRLLGAKMGYIVGGNSIQTNDTWIINCINYSRDSSRVMSNSWGGGAASGAVNTAMTNARNAGLLILFSSGNGNTSVQWPATQTSVMAIGATNESDDRCDPGDWGFGQGSNFGSQLDVVAAGNNTYTIDMTGTDGYSNNDYDPGFGGTSAACPIAAGVCALIYAVDPSLTPAQVQNILQTTADDLVGAAGEDVAGWDQYMGWGRINANDAVRYVFGPASNLAATSGLVNVPLTWSVPWRTPNSYDVHRSTTGQFGVYSVIGNSATTSYNDNAVTGGVTYWYKVKAVYTNGQSDFSNAASATPVIAYNPPQNLLAQGGLNAQVPVSWQAPVSGTPIRYDLYRSTTGQFGAYALLAPIVHPTLNYTDLAVSNGSEYWYKAKAVFSGPNESAFSNADSARPVAPPNAPPVLTHDPLDDFAPGSGVITALASDTEPAAAIASIKMFRRLVGAGSFDSTNLTATGNPQEYSASLAGLAAGSYEYYVRAADNLGLTTLVPAGAPASLYSFDVDDLCATELAYDDGSAESYNYPGDDAGVGILWAVKFGPVQYPFVLCGARFAAARTIPSSVHTQVYFAVYLADGAGGLPGLLVQDGITGSIGNDVGGTPPGTNWAQIVLHDDLGQPLQINAPEFYVAVSNEQIGKIEAFGRDSNGANAHRSYFYDTCEDEWISEDDLINPNAYPGNRLIRAQGFPLVPPTVVIRRIGNDIRLDWNNLGAPLYRVYSAPTAAGPFTTLEGQSTGTSFLDVGAVGAPPLLLHYIVRSVAE